MDKLDSVLDRVIKDLGLAESLDSEIYRAWISDDGSKTVSVAQGLTHEDYAKFLVGYEPVPTDIKAWEDSLRSARKLDRELGRDTYDDSNRDAYIDALSHGWIRLGCFTTTTYMEVWRLTKTQLKLAQSFLNKNEQFRRGTMRIEQKNAKSRDLAYQDLPMSDFLGIRF